MITPPLSISARPVFNRGVYSLIAVRSFSLPGLPGFRANRMILSPGRLRGETVHDAFRHAEVEVKPLPWMTLLLVLLAPPTAAEPTAREKALAHIDALIEADELEEAEHRIEHLLRHNAGDPGLVALRAKLRIRQGRLEDLLRDGVGLLRPDRRADLRGICWRIVEATASGNSEEFAAIAAAGDADRALALLRRLSGRGSAEQKRVAIETLARAGDTAALKAIEERLRGGDPAALRALPEDRLARHGKLLTDLLRAPSPPPEVFESLARLNDAAARPAIRRHLESDEAPVRVAAAGALLAMGDRGARVVLLKAYRTGSPVEAVAALTHLAARPKPGKTSLLALLREVEEKPPVPRLKPELVEIVLTAIGRRGGPAAREALEARLKAPATAMAAARALGRLGDPEALPAVFAFLVEPPEETGTEGAAEGGLGFLGRSTAGEAASRAADLQPRLVGALSLLQLTR
jgi:HEAT repeat protein